MVTFEVSIVIVPISTIASLAFDARLMRTWSSWVGSMWIFQRSAPGTNKRRMFSPINGRGMDRETKEKIFEPFFTTKPKGQGTGLGLSTVYGIVKQNGGNLNVYSEPGRGTTFRIYFPRYFGEVREFEPKQPQEPLSGSGTVMVVEDQPDLLNLAKDTLEDFGYRVITALSPSEAILLFGMFREEIDLVLTDVIMPIMNGNELRSRIEKVKPDIKTLFMSGYTANVITDGGMLNEGIEFIQKPFTPKTLAKKVRDVLNSK